MGPMNDLPLFKRLAVAVKMQRSEVKITKTGLYGRSNLSPTQACDTVAAILDKHGLLPRVAVRRHISGVEIILGSCAGLFPDERIVYFVFTETSAGTLVSVAGADRSKEE